jgi:hypothetical protein
MVIEPSYDSAADHTLFSFYDDRSDCSGADYPSGDCKIAFIRPYSSNDAYGSGMTWTYRDEVALGHNVTTTVASEKLFWTDLKATRWLVARWAAGAARSNPWFCFVTPSHNGE